MKKPLKITLIVLASLAVLLVITGLFIRYALSEPLKEALIKEFENQTEHNYQLTLSDLHVGLINRSVTAQSIRVEANSDIPHIRSIEAASLSMKGISWLSLLEQSLPTFEKIVIQSPRVQLKERTVRASSFENEAPSDSSNMRDLTLFDVIIHDGAGSIIRDDSTELFTAEGIEMEARQVDLNRLLDGSALLFLEDLDLSGGSLKWSLSDKYYEISSNGFRLDKSDRSLDIAGLTLLPTLPKYKFSQAYGHQLDRIHLEIPEIYFYGVDLDSLSSQRLSIDSMFIQDPWLEVFRDKHLERKPGVGQPKPMLHDATEAIDLAFQLGSLRIQNGTIIYEEHKPPSDSSGHISFDNLSATLGPFRSASHPHFTKDPLILDVDTDFMNAGALKVDINYPFYRADNYHHVTVRLGPIDPKTANEMLERVGLVRVEEGMVQALNAEFQLNNAKSSGKLTVLYDSLKVSLLNKRNPELENIFQRAGDLVANTFIIKSNNRGDEPREGTISHEREEQKSIFAYWWHSLLSGLKDSVR